ncbi:hypothetical protein RDWZM_000150 [Blomia tropicalis]|uniref:Uncharacterized protein n=1 Tax=Blomia tropicalis TaxID=40697 RepID=A0A9Q0RPH9_BLOTA|nr:hypothetical protein BLOT_010646 [Blomia tropicalis]KAJ6221605.1 hypothetical protein RDWZM_000150 [Blomia tropicalis]
MSAIPFTTFSVKSIHDMVRARIQQEEKDKGRKNDLGSSKDESSNLKPFGGEIYNYNLKFMKSVWGMYNQYAPQAFQKNEELI